MQQFSYQNSDQSAATSVLEKILSQKCKLHRQFVCEFLHMKPSDSSPRLCIKCMEVRNIQANEYISIRLLLEASITTTFNAYPKFNDNSITQQIQQYRDTSDKVQEELSSFFENLQSTILLTIEKLKIAQKEKLASLQASYQSIYDTLAQISQVEKLKTLIKNENEEELKYFINQQFSSADTYTQKINNNLNEYKKIYEGFSLNEPMNQLNQIVKLIERIQFFPTILQNIANNSQQQSHFSYQPQQQRDQLLLQQQQQQLQHELQLKQMQQQQQQQEQQYEQQQQLQHQKQQLQKQQKQQQQQQLIEQQRSTSSQSVYAEYQSLVKQGVEKKILWSESSSKLEWWWESSWESSKKEWWSSLKELLKKSYARTYEEWQAFSENERQEQLNILRKYVHLSN